MFLHAVKECLTRVVELSPARLAALVAIADTGSFEAAAARLHVTPSAISQRIRALESTVGRVLVGRGTPCVPTDAGADLVRLGRQLELVFAEAWNEGPTDLALAVNADSLATWFRPVLAEVATWEGVALRLRVEDEGHSHDLLRRGEVVAAVTSDPSPVQGCSVTPLGTMRYLPVAHPRLLGPGGRPDWSAMPMVVFNAKDRLQHEELRRHTDADPAVVHEVPSSDDFRAAVEAGLGWGLLPESQARAALDDARLVRLGRSVTRVALYWQRWKLNSDLLDRMSESVLAHAPRTT
ncbi:LysR family transcriptional regulator ArgP [Aeromicrobium choanae]|uniref:LysR family transcriptional regulator, chromosome initiation inhibitor n=1 Tax=Aeromicrobium choanae TaxID=1736691 RepID=A0A1T4YQ56_9ACTN|nr:LysR family transcriptional regulator ArgP [Aeromicrobium choanae]SKB03984.1 LysR family transcriptional regulator, chromosome initiation inhibitor [Aeromicrobium choanae]